MVSNGVEWCRMVLKGSRLTLIRETCASTGRIILLYV
jgi:hypothetical protein